MPSFISTKRCCINVKNVNSRFKKNENLRCFEYAIEAILNPDTKSIDRYTKHDITKYEKLNMNYPIDINNIENIEKYENFLNISINIYSYDDNVINLIHRSNYFKVYEKKVNLLEYKNHIVGIKNISALLKGQVTKHKQNLFMFKIS